MNIDRVQLTNFRQHADTVLEFPNELIGIIGQNESGKSTILEAIAWALYGSQAVRGTMDTVRWKGAPARSPAEVNVEFSVGGDDYIVHRSENDASLTQNGEVIAEGLSGVDEKMPEVLGMTYDEFSATHLCRQGELDNLREMGGTERRRFVLRVMGLDRIDGAIEACRDRKNDLKHEVEGLRQGIGEREPLERELKEAREAVSETEGRLEETLRPRLSKAEDQLESAEAQFEQSRKEKKRHQELRQAKESASSEASKAGRELKRAQKKLEEARQARAKVEDKAGELDEMEDLRDEASDLREARARAGERETVSDLVTQAREKVQRLEEEKTELDARITELEGVDERYEKVRREREKKAERLEDLREERREHCSQAKANARSLEGRIQKQEKRLQALRGEGEDGACPVCLRALGDQYETVISGLEDRLQDLREQKEDEEIRAAHLSEPDDEEESLAVEVEKLEGREQELEEQDEALSGARSRRLEVVADLEDAEDELQARRGQLADLPEAEFDEDRLARVETRIGELEEMKTKLQKLQARADRIPELEEEVERWKSEQSQAREREKKALAELRELGFDSSRHGDLEARLQSARKTREKASQAVARAEEKLEAARERVERAEEKLAEYDERASDLRKKEEAYQAEKETDERLTDFRTAMAASIRPELEDLTSGFLQLLTDGRHEAVELTEDFEPVVQETGGEVEVISGGAQDITAIAMRLAISQLIAERAGHPLSLLVLDEPFGSLDAVRRQNVLSLIRRLGSTFEQTLLITHVEEVQDAVDRSVRVTYDEAEGRSEVEAQAAADVEVAA